MTGERLVSAKLAVPDDAKPPLTSLGPRSAESLRRRMCRWWRHSAPPASGQGVLRGPTRRPAVGRAARLRADEAGKLAHAARLDVDDVWAHGMFEAAARNLFETRTVTQPDGTVVEERVPRRATVGNAGYDVTFTLPKSLSLLLAFAEPEFAAEVERVYLAAVESTFAWLETQTAYGMRGKHGDGHTARTIPRRVDS